jgi:hypothetical protein
MRRSQARVRVIQRDKQQHEIKERCAFMKHNHNPQALATDWRKLLAEMKNADAFS